MRRKYKNVKNRPLPIDGIGSVGGRETFWVEEDQMTGRIRQLEESKQIRFIEEQGIEDIPDEPEAPKEELKESSEPVVDTIDETNEEIGIETGEEKDDNLLTNDEEVMESKEEVKEEEANTNDSIATPSKSKKKSKKKGRKGKPSTDRA